MSFSGMLFFEHNQQAKIFSVVPMIASRLGGSEPGGTHAANLSDQHCLVGDDSLPGVGSSAMA
jgi:hypothetical protein